MTEQTHSASDPRHSASVLASAGTGKTWQLVARLTRLLLHGARLDSLLAITFTRKAAGEMQQRLNQRLRALLEADDAQLDAQLIELGETPDAELRRRARGLYESTLRSEQPLRASTFHSFCQDLLRRFPLEAELPPGFELAEHTGLLINEAWDALFADVTAAPQQALADAVTTLFDRLNGLHNTRLALVDFVEHRSDWWAYTQDSDNPVDSAVEQLQRALAVDTGIAGGKTLWRAGPRAELAEYRTLLAKHNTASFQTTAGQLAGLLQDTHDSDDATRCEHLYPLFFTGKDTPRARKHSKPQQRSMGADGEARFLQLHALFCERLENWREHRNRLRTLDSNRAWYTAGARMLAHYQRIKRERRLLDFTDLEWHAWRLLNHPEHAHWVQYKLDQRIDHLLIDEFQDTNPTQWRLILPLLQEIAAGGERARSLFIVGDAKQSIYRFRRGNPRLLGHAADWMQQQLQAPRIHLDASWRSSPLIMDCVNRVFRHPDLQGQLEDFQPHSTHRDKLWGRVELWPLVEAEPALPDDADNDELRNPLQQPRPFYRDSRHLREGRAIAARIQQLVDDGIAAYGDIMILMRSRTHLPDYEDALRERRIPYLSLDRGTLLESLEIRDLEALLRVLITPQDNLSLAQVLRSPLFAAGDDDLLHLAAHSSGSWYERLQAVAQDRNDTQQPLVRAARDLQSWHALAGRVPIHDLLQTIFHQADVAARFEAAFHASQSARLRANLTRFIELALEVDAGRYPTLPRFLERLRQLRGLDREGPSQATPGGDAQRVQVLTIHAAKGLEAPVVFLADSGRSTAPRGPRSLVQWPADADRPAAFMLLGNSRQRDSLSRQRAEQEQSEEQREAANLLYVALTRARHMLVISGCHSDKTTRAPSWHRQLANALCGEPSPTETWLETYRTAPVQAPAPAAVTAPQSIDPRLRQTIAVTPPWHEIAPSRQVRHDETHDGDSDGSLRGRVIHRLLELGADQADPGALQTRLLQRVAHEQHLAHHDPRLQDWWREALAVLTHPGLAALLQPAAPHKSYKEVPIQYRQNGRTVYGIIDRLVVERDRIHLIDFKSHRPDDAAQAERLAEDYRPQMRLYREGVQRLWPQRPVHAYLLLTRQARLIELDLSAS